MRDTIDDTRHDERPIQEPMQSEPFVSIEAEAALLGAILFANESYERVADLLKSTHFADPLHAQIYEAAGRLIGAGKRATPITLRPFFEGHDPVNSGLTVPHYLARLLVQATTIINVRSYAETIRENARRREFVALVGRMMETAYDSNFGTTSTKLIERFEAELFSLAETDRASREMTLAQAVQEAERLMDAAHKNGGKIIGVSSGLRDLDEKVGGGLSNSDLIVLAGRPAMGKTALATGIAFAAATTDFTDEHGELQHGHVHFFSQEMSGSQLAARLLAEHSGIPSQELRRGGHQRDDETFRDKYLPAKAKVAAARMTIDDTGGITIAQLATRARRIKRRHGTTLLVIDYIQLMQGGKGGDQNRVQEITAITTGLKALAKELNVPILALSQLSRKVEERQDKRPQLSDLRESGSIEQDADIVMFVYRDEYYLEKSMPEPGTPEFSEHAVRLGKAKGKAEVIIGKQRHGPTGMVELHFEADKAAFHDLARPDQIPDGRGAQ